MSDYTYSEGIADLLFKPLVEKNTPSLKVKKLNEDTIIPTRGSTSAAGWDLYANLDEDEIHIYPDETIKINTGIAVAIPEGFFGAIFARSGLATKQGLRPANCVGVVDADYRGPVIVAMHNDSDDRRTIKNGDRIAQLVLIPYLNVSVKEVEELDETERGVNGFGSTGTR